MDLLRISVSGSVDDGKSTLTGRLLYDTKSIFEDQVDALKRISHRKGIEELDLSLVTDGLKEERIQGITIDVAYRYFATPRRKFILADTPGHLEYTRNMITGASTANLMIILVDARNGVVEQTRRHAFIASLLRIQHLVICINKMDLLNFSKDTFESIREAFEQFSSKLDIPDIRYLPISALKGDNVVEKTENMPWYDGPTLLYTLENIHVGNDQNMVDSRFPVQSVIHSLIQNESDFLGYAGRIAGGVFKPSDEVMVLPSGMKTRIKDIRIMDRLLEEAFSPMSVVMTFEDDIEIKRGDMVVKPNNQPKIGQEIELMICWMNEKPLSTSTTYKVRQTTRNAHCQVNEVRYKVNINTLHRLKDDKEIGLNDIGRIQIRTTIPFMYDSYRRNRTTGSLILIDESTHETVAAGIVL